MLVILLLVNLSIAAVSSASYIILPSLAAVLLINNNLRIPRLNGIGLILFIIVLLAFVSIVQSQDLINSTKFSSRYIAYVFLVAVFYNLADKIRVDRLVFLLAMLPWLLVPLSNFYHTSSGPGLGRYAFVFSHPNHFAYFLIPIGIFYVRQGFGNLFARIGLISIFMLLLLSRSSGGFLVLTLAVLYQYRVQILKPKILFGVVVVSFLVFYLGVSERLTDQFSIFGDGLLLNQLYNENLGGAGSLSWRIIYWYLMVRDIFELPILNILFGSGFGTMSQGGFIFDFMYTDPHNDYIRLLGETGILGITLFFFILFKISQGLGDLKGLFLISVLFPMFIGNVIVNPSYVLMLILVFLYLHKTRLNEESA